jgi:hypothetical protein
MQPSTPRKIDNLRRYHLYLRRKRLQEQQQNDEREESEPADKRETCNVVAKPVNRTPAFNLRLLCMSIIKAILLTMVLSKIVNDMQEVCNLSDTDSNSSNENKELTQSQVN